MSHRRSVKIDGADVGKTTQIATYGSVTSNELALSAALTQVHFELEEMEEKALEAAKLATRARERAAAGVHHCEHAASQLRAAVAQSRVTAELLNAVRGIIETERQVLRDMQARLAKAQLRKRRAHKALVELRKRQQSIERALKVERYKSSAVLVTQICIAGVTGAQS